jgi:outer membrane protein assembly factor BamB
VYVATDDHRVIALRSDSGEPLWQRTFGGPPNEIFADADRVYVGSENNFFYALMTKDGRVDWRWRTGGDVVGTPLVDEHRVYVVALDNVLRALARDSGVQHWMRPLPLRPITGPVRAASSKLDPKSQRRRTSWSIQPRLRRFFCM